MTAQLIDGVALSQKLRAQFAHETQALVAQGVKPGLAVILDRKSTRLNSSH